MEFQAWGTLSPTEHLQFKDFLQSTAEKQPTSESEPSEKENTRGILTRFGRLRAWCGYIGPTAPLGFLGKWLLPLLDVRATCLGTEINLH